MSPISAGLLLACFSALTTSLAHALLKAGNDKLAVQAWVRLTELAVALPLALWVGLPPANLWPWLIAAGGVHLLYQYILTWSYRVSDFTLAFPIARGVTPLITAALAALWLGDQLRPAAFAGVALVSAGLLSLSRGSGITRPGLLLAAFTGLLTCCYTLIDAKGMRASPDMLTFLVWFFVIDGLGMPLVLLLRDRGRAVTSLIPEMRTGILAGVMALMAFVPALVAFRLAPVGAVAAIREGSVIIGLALGAKLLKEELDQRRIIGGVLVTIGAAIIVLTTAQT
ncbi:MAG: EamA family transporter [Sphingomonadales bacterium]|nr:EamA family transporter [Sphingomonadales bacterium]